MKLRRNVGRLMTVSKAMTMTTNSIFIVVIICGTLLYLAWQVLLFIAEVYYNRRAAKELPRRLEPAPTPVLQREEQHASIFQPDHSNSFDRVTTTNYNKTQELGRLMRTIFLDLDILDRWCNFSTAEAQRFRISKPDMQMLQYLTSVRKLELERRKRADVSVISLLNSVVQPDLKRSFQYNANIPYTRFLQDMEYLGMLFYLTSLNLCDADIDLENKPREKQMLLCFIWNVLDKWGQSLGLDLSTEQNAALRNMIESIQGLEKPVWVESEGAKSTSETEMPIKKTYFYLVHEDRAAQPWNIHVLARGFQTKIFAKRYQAERDLYIYDLWKGTQVLQRLEDQEDGLPVKLIWVAEEPDDDGL
jgi:hypothetical protein